MEIQADLIKLDASGQLPLPWLVRAHLGLETNTGVSVFLTRPLERARVKATPPAVDGGSKRAQRREKEDSANLRISDILVSPLTTNRVKATFSVDVSIPEGPGAIQRVLSKFNDRSRANIVVSETITLEGRERHKLSLVIEPTTDDNTANDFRDYLQELLVEFSVKKSDIRLTFDTEQSLIFQAPLRIENAYLPSFNWKELIQEQPGAHLYDLNSVVVSSDPAQRVLRFVFPKKGAFQLEVPHLNRAGALDAITRVIAENGFNIVSSRLSRTPRPPMTELMSVFVAVCEPLESGRDRAHNKRRAEQLCEAVRQIDQKYVTNKAMPSYGKRAERTRYPQPRHARFVLPPEHLLKQMQAERSAVINQFRSGTGNGATRRRGMFDAPVVPRIVFVSHRFVFNKKAASEETKKEYKDSLDVILEAIEKAGCIAFAPRASFTPDTTAEVIYPRLWAADVCLILALNEYGRGELSSSQAHEYGFFMGQRKQARILVRAEKLPDTGTLGNLDGFIRLTYDGEVQDRESDYSLYTQVLDFLGGSKTPAASTDPTEYMHWAT